MCVLVRWHTLAAVLFASSVTAHARLEQSERLGEALADETGVCQDTASCGRNGLGLLQLQAAPEAAKRHALASQSLVATKSNATVNKTFDCAALPQYCGSPLHCDVADLEEEKQSWKEVIAKEKPNLKFWCHLEGQPFAGSLIQQCLVNKDLKKSAIGVYEEQARQNALEADASYCFIAGHCSSERVANNASIEDGVRMCDAKYGRDEWTTKFGQKNMMMISWVKNKDLEQATGFHASGPAHMFAKLACAMGNYHCDNVYCHEHYCHNEYYQKRYGCYAHQEPQRGQICPGAQV